MRSAATTDAGRRPVSTRHKESGQARASIAPRSTGLPRVDTARPPAGRFLKWKIGSKPNFCITP